MNTTPSVTGDDNERTGGDIGIPFWRIWCSDPGMGKTSAFEESWLWLEDSVGYLADLVLAKVDQHWEVGSASSSR